MSNWIAGAVKHPGSFGVKAQHAGESTGQFAAQEAHAPGQLGRQARLASTLMGLPHHADGGVIAPGAPTPQPQSRLAALWQNLFGRNALAKAAEQGSQAPPPSPPPEAQDTSAVRRAAEDAGRRMEAVKAAQSRPPMCNGGIVR